MTRASSKFKQLDIKLNEERKANKDTKNELRKMLQRFQDRKLSDYEFRILQGVFQRDFGHLEHKKKLKD